MGRKQFRIYFGTKIHAGCVQFVSSKQSMGMGEMFGSYLVYVCDQQFK